MCFIFELNLKFTISNYWFSHDAIKIQTKRFYFHQVLEQFKANIFTNFYFERVLHFVMQYPRIFKALRDAVF